MHLNDILRDLERGMSYSCHMFGTAWHVLYNKATAGITGLHTFGGLMDCHRSVSIDSVFFRNSCRIPTGQLAGRWASRLAQSFCVRVGMLRHGASSFTRDACQHHLSSAFPTDSHPGHEDVPGVRADRQWCLKIFISAAPQCSSRILL